MPIAGVIAEGVLTLILLVAVVKLFFGWTARLPLTIGRISVKSLFMFSLAILERLVSAWRPDISRVRVFFGGALLVLANLIVLRLSQDISYDHAMYSSLLLLVPIMFFFPACDRSMPLWIRIVAIGAAVWIVTFFEVGLVFPSCFAVLSATVVLAFIFQWWRDPRDEGFVKTKLADWKWAGGALCFFFVAMLAIGWESLMITDYSAKMAWVPLVSFALYPIVKAIPEERVFRGIFQGALKDRFGFFPALIGATILYGIAALNNPAPWAFPNWHAAVNALLLGLGCGYVYNKTKSLAISGAVNAVVSFGWHMLFARGGF